MYVSINLILQVNFEYRVDGFQNRLASEQILKDFHEQIS